MNFLSIDKISNHYFKHKIKLKRQLLLVFFIFFFIQSGFVFIADSTRKSLSRFFVDKPGLTIVPKDLNLGLIKVKTPSLFGKGELTESDLERLRSFDNLKSVIPVYTVKIPTHISGNIMNMNYGTDLSIYAQDEPFEELNLKADTLSSQSIIPAAVSPKIVDLYNVVFAPANNLPKISPVILKNFTFDLYFGRNSFSAKKNWSSHPVTVKVLSEEVETFGLTLPLQYVKIMAKIQNEKVTISKIKIYPQNPDDLVKIKEKLTVKGYAFAKESNEFYQSQKNYLLTLEIAAAILSIAFLLIILMLISGELNYQLLSRKFELGIQIATGYYQKDLIQIWLIFYLKVIIKAFVLAPLLMTIIVYGVYYFIPLSWQNIIIPDFSIIKYLLISMIVLSFAYTLIYLKLNRFFTCNNPIALINEGRI